MSADGDGEEGGWWAWLCGCEPSCSQRVLGLAGTLAGLPWVGLCECGRVFSGCVPIVAQLMQIDGDGGAGEGNGGAEGGRPVVLAGAGRRPRPLKLLVCIHLARHHR